MRPTEESRVSKVKYPVTFWDADQSLRFIMEVGATHHSLMKIKGEPLTSTSAESLGLSLRVAFDNHARRNSALPYPEPEDSTAVGRALGELSQAVTELYVMCSVLRSMDLEPMAQQIECDVAKPVLRAALELSPTFVQDFQIKSSTPASEEPEDVLASFRVKPTDA